MESNDVKKLRSEIEELRELLEVEVTHAFGAQESSRRDDESISFSYELQGFGGAPTKNFQQVLEDYGVDYTDDKQLFELVKELNSIRRYCEKSAREINGEFNKANARELLAKMKTELNQRRKKSPLLSNLPDAEWEARLATLDIGSGSWRYDLRGKLDEFIFQLEQETDVAKGVRVMNKSPELMELYSDLTGMQKTVTEMEEDIETVDVCTAYINELGILYSGIASINAKLRDPKTTEDKGQLEAERRKLIDSIYEMTSKAENPHKGIEKIREMFSDDGQLIVDDRAFMQGFQEGLEDLSFEVNSRKGKVNDKMLRRDMYDIERAESIEALDAADKSDDPKARKEQMDKLAKNKELKRYAKMLELQRILEKIAKLFEEGERLKTRKNEIRKELARKDLSPEDRAKLEAEFAEVVGNLRTLFGKIPELQDKAKSLANELGIKEISNLDSIKITGKSLEPVKNALQKQRDNAQKRKNKACERYGADPKKSYGEIRGAVKERVDQIKTKKWVRANEVNAPGDTPIPAGSTQRVPVGAPGGTAFPTPLNFSGRPAPTSITSNSFGTGSPLISNPGQAQPRVGMPGSVPTPAPAINPNEVNAPESIDPVDDQETLDATVEYLMHKRGKLVEKMTTSEAKVKQISPKYQTRIESGVVYRYTRGSNPDEVYFWQEPLERYLEDPKKKLNEVLDGLRKRFEEELGGKDEVEDFLAEGSHNDYLEGLLSKNPMKRNAAKKKFIKKLEEMNPGDEQMAYVSMAIALQSEMEPDKIDETLSRYAQPYPPKNNDMGSYVRPKTKKRLFGQKQELKIKKKLLERAKEKNGHSDQERGERPPINLTPDTDGTIDLFQYGPEALGEDRESQKKPSQRREQNKGPNKGRRNHDSAPGGR